MAVYDYDLIVIGGGAAGLTVAAGASQLGVKTLLAEREPQLGGDCLHYGCVPSKTLIKSAKVYHLMRRSRDFGLPGVEPGPVDFAQVAARIRRVVDAIQEHDSPERFCKLGAQVAFGPAQFADEHTVLVDGKPRTGERIVIATGSAPAIPPIPGLAEAGCLTNRELFSLDRLPASLVVLGAGPIACEMAQSFARLGSRVAMVQRGGQVLSREDPDMAQVVLESLRADGVEVLLDTAVEAVRAVASGKQVDVRAGDGSVRSLAAEEVLAAMGRTPNTDGLALDKAGVALDRKGVAVDARLRTSAKHVFAAGDVTGAYQFTHAAGYEGSIVVSNAVFRLPRKADYTWLPWCTYTDPELASVGLNEKRAKEAGLDFSVWTEEFGGNDRALAEGEGRGRIKLLLGKDDKPLGVQIVGPSAGELINEWVAVLGGKVKLTTLAGAVHPYPTLGEINKRVAGKMLSEKLFSDKVRGVLSFVFRYQGRACDLDD